MANSILSSALSSASFSITNQTTGTNAATTLAVSRVTIRLRSQLHRHMREDGLTLIDARTIMATELDVDGFAPDLSTLEQINSVLSNRDDMFTITSKGVILSPMRLENLLVSQTPNVLSAAPVRVTFKQALAPAVAAITFKQAADSSLVDRGIAFLNQASENVSSLYSKVASIF